MTKPISVNKLWDGLFGAGSIQSENELDTAELEVGSKQDNSYFSEYRDRWSDAWTSIIKVPRIYVSSGFKCLDTSRAWAYIFGSSYIFFDKAYF